MRRSLFNVAVVVAALLAGSAWGYQNGPAKRSTYKDADYGFTIDAPRFPGSGSKGATVFMSAGPSDGKFAPNVNVLVEHAKTTAEIHLDDSVAQIEKAGLKINERKTRKVSGRDAVEIDYEGTLNGIKDLRFLSLSVIEKDRIIIVTCTAPIATFDAVEAECRACLDSLKFD